MNWTWVRVLASSGGHLRILLSEISCGEEVDEMLNGRIGLMIRLLDRGWLRGSILGPTLKEGVGQWSTYAFVKEDEEGSGAGALVGQSIRVRPADALE